ncbi:MAG: hypothetical protein Q9226_004217 [Calogaya cf. arnoldii]
MAANIDLSTSPNHPTKAHPLLTPSSNGAQAHARIPLLQFTAKEDRLLALADALEGLRLAHEANNKMEILERQVRQLREALGLEGPLT